MNRSLTERGTDGLKCRLDNSLPLATRGLVNRVSMTPKRKPSRFHLEPPFSTAKRI